MRWSELLHRRAHGRAIALAQAQAPGPAALASWRLPAPARPAVLEALAVARPDPRPESFAAMFAPEPGLAPEHTRDSHPLHVWWARLERGCPPVEPEGVTERRAWAIMALGWLGEERDRLERRAWAAALPEQPGEDAAALGLWRAWFAGDLRRLWSQWPARYRSAAQAGARGAHPIASRQRRPAELADEPALDPLGLRRWQQRAPFGADEGDPDDDGPDQGAHHWHDEAAPKSLDPRAEIAWMLRELGEDLVLICAGAERGGVPAWREIAARVLEGAALDGPVAGMAELLGRGQRAKVAGCAPHHATWGGSWRQIAPPPEDGDEVRAFDDLLLAAGADGLALDGLLDAHLVLTLLARWRDPARTGAEASWRVVGGQLGRARGRLRALLVEAEDRHLLEALHGVPALHARTAAAVRRHFYEWARKNLRVGRRTASGALNAPCALPRPVHRRRDRDAEDRAAERCWLLLVLLRGQERALIAWLRDGGATSGTFARLLLELPDALVDLRVGPHRTYHDLRASLGRRLDGYRAELGATLIAVAGLEGVPARARRSAIEAVLGPVWHRSLPLPAHGYPSMIAAARALLAAGGA